jgi:Spy/CpxP family protein refolding chaperone
MTPLARRRLWFAIFVVVVFCLGMATGGVVADRYRASGPRTFGMVRVGGPMFSGQMVERVSRELELTPKQRQRLEEIAEKLRPSAPGPGHIADRMSQDLDLTPAQRIQLETVLQRNGERLERFRGDTAAKFDALRRQLDSEISVILTPEQRARFDEERKRRERTRPHGPGEPRPFPPPLPPR